MKSIVSQATFAGVFLAQNSIIGIPTAGQKLTKGSNVVIQLERPNSLTDSTEIAVVIGISSCASIACRPAGEVMGTILYNGDFDPQYYEASSREYTSLGIAFGVFRISVSVPSNNICRWNTCTSWF
ncbi:hypothetical protein PENFLA_c107G10169 [Penicillium flavigenum]|uniref:Uncharacterized protein n=1 Tax=Penicillium flavigenum TaxID=254877 RepID=A0A1V6S641_9EURO|nr:hypothetical protein PENFLA_c107G10169 [Penicillium flavigenum]